jgi:hypothetical protein
MGGTGGIVLAGHEFFAAGSNWLSAATGKNLPLTPEGLIAQSAGAPQNAVMATDAIVPFIGTVRVSRPAPPLEAAKNLGNLTEGQATRIQAFANKYNTPVTVVGSRAGGQELTEFSDFDYIIGGTSKIRRKGLYELPRGIDGGDRPPLEIWSPLKNPLDPSKPHIIFNPEGT